MSYMNKHTCLQSLYALNRKCACVWLSHQSDWTQLHKLLILPFIPSCIGFMCIHWSQSQTAQQLERFAASKDAHSQIRLISTLARPIRGAWIGCMPNESHVSIPNLLDEADARARYTHTHISALDYTTHWQSAFPVSCPCFTSHWKLIYYLYCQLMNLILSSVKTEGNEILPWFKGIK